MWNKPTNESFPVTPLSTVISNNLMNMIIDIIQYTTRTDIKLKPVFY